MSKMSYLKRLLLNGKIATQKEFARILDVPTYQVRSYICSFRKKGMLILNYPIPGSNETKYGIAVNSSFPKEAVNKTVFTLPIEPGRFVYTKVD